MEYFFSGSGWIQGWHKYECGDDGVDVSGCVAPFRTYIPIGEVKSVNNFNATCTKNEKDEVTMHCIDTRGGRNKALEWKEGPRMYKCTESGVEAIGCVTTFGIHSKRGREVGELVMNEMMALERRFTASSYFVMEGRVSRTLTLYSQIRHF
ncbi:hypothetical protein KIN20_021891 [Parelaphostrongylus tenuis]|uniref:Uncharacterized protein n=1 Tax=Parelaphostrongylus tenuis TaxID=148309 RepID=A0AAD5QUG6_PARTN|nr:hypothetical protein KIN20_021891 [Parelaphostrongylus tenuis]